MSSWCFCRNGVHLRETYLIECCRRRSDGRTLHSYKFKMAGVSFQENGRFYSLSSSLPSSFIPDQKQKEGKSQLFFSRYWYNSGLKCTPKALLFMATSQMQTSEHGSTQNNIFRSRKQEKKEDIRYHQGIAFLFAQRFFTHGKYHYVSIFKW